MILICSIVVRVLGFWYLRNLAKICGIIYFFMAGWLCDFEAFHFEGNFYPVELVLLHSQTKVCIIYNIHWNSLPYTVDTTPCIKFQYRRHGICWDAGDVTVQEAIKLVKQQIANDNDVIYVKGYEKWRWLSQRFDNVKELPEYIATLSKTKPSCDGKRCAFHSLVCNLGKMCAMEKCYILLERFGLCICR